MSEQDVYGSASGPLARLAGPLAARARTRRHAQLVTLTGLEPADRILDIGCGTLGLRAHLPDAAITGIDLIPRPTYPGPFLQADATQPLPWPDGTFDLVVANSVVEHIAPADRPAFAREVRRLGGAYAIQTPAFSFPVEPHALLPGAHWLPPGPRRAYWRLGAQDDWEEIALLGRAELQGLFPDATLTAERAAGLTKSWLAVRRRPGGRPPPGSS